MLDPSGTSFGNIRHGGSPKVRPANSTLTPGLLFHHMSVFTKLLAGLTPPPVVVPEDYDGLEWRWKFFTFRPACTSFDFAVAGYLDAPVC